MRRKHRLRVQLAKIPTDKNSDDTRTAIESTLGLSLNILDAISKRIEDLYDGNTMSTEIEHEKLAQSIDELCALVSAPHSTISAPASTKSWICSKSLYLRLSLAK